MVNAKWKMESDSGRSGEFLRRAEHQRAGTVENDRLKLRHANDRVGCAPARRTAGTLLSVLPHSNPPQEGPPMSSRHRGQEGGDCIRGAFEAARQAIQCGVGFAQFNDGTPERFHPLQAFFRCYSVMMQRLRIRFVDEVDARLSETRAPFNVLPSVKARVFPKGHCPRDVRWDGNMARVGKEMLDCPRERAPAEAADFPVPELPAGPLQPAHHRRDPHGWIPCRESQYRRTVRVRSGAWPYPQMAFACIRCKEDVVPDEEADRGQRFLHAAVAGDPLLARFHFEEADRHVPVRSAEEGGRLLILPVAHHDDFQLIRNRLPLQMFETSPEDRRPLVGRDDDGEGVRGFQYSNTLLP